MTRDELAHHLRLLGIATRADFLDLMLDLLNESYCSSVRALRG